jgi:23S rRNA maturation-related 3'-5' exoribonuclease YhaM
MTKIAVGCITPNTIKAILDRFHAKTDSVKEKVWDCTNKDVKTFVEKTVAKANLLVEQAGNACRNKSMYQHLLPFLQ